MGRAGALCRDGSLKRIFPRLTVYNCRVDLLLHWGCQHGSRYLGDDKKDDFVDNEPATSLLQPSEIPPREGEGSSPVILSSQQTRQLRFLFKVQQINGVAVV